MASIISGAVDFKVIPLEVECLLLTESTRSWKFGEWRLSGNCPVMGCEYLNFELGC